MQSCFLTVLGEVIRMTLTNSTPYKILSITLTPVPNQGNRARAAARFTVSVSLSWGPLPWAAGVLLVDSRGYPLQWQLDAVGKWLVKSLSGADCVVNMTITNGAHIPARWSLARITAAAAKVSGVEAQDVIDDAAAKVTSVALWAASDRKTAVIDAARRMTEAAALLLVAQSVQRGGALGGAFVPEPDPDPVPGPGVTDGPDSEARCDAVTGIYAGSITVADELQFVGVNLVAGVSVKIDVQGVDGGAGTLVDPAFDVFDSAGVFKDVSGDDFVAGLDERWWFVPAVSGLYFVRVYAADSGLGSYRVTVAPGVAPEPDPDPVEPGTDYPLDIADLAGAPVLTLGAAVTSQLETNGDTDFFAVDLVAGGVYDVSLSGFGALPLSGAVSVAVLNAAGDVQQVGDVWVPGLSTFYPADSGRYFVSIHTHTGYGDSLGAYSLTVAVQV